MIRQAALSIVIPVALGGAVLLMAAWLSRGGRRTRLVRAAPGLAIAVTFIAGFVAIEGWPHWPPASRWHLLPVLTAASAVVGVGIAWVRSSPAIVVGSALLTGTMASLLVSLPGVDAVGWRAGLGLTVCLSVLLLERQGTRRPGAAMPLVWLITFSTLAALLGISGFSKLALISTAAAAVSGIAALVTANLLRFSTEQAGSLVVATLIPTLALTGYSYDFGRVHPASWILVAVAPAMMWLGEWGYVRRRSPAVKGAVQTAAVLLPCVIAVALCDLSGLWDTAQAWL